MRTLQVDDNPTRLAHAIAEFGQIDKTLHTLNIIVDENKRRSTLTKEELLYSFCQSIPGDVELPPRASSLA
jgi:TnpA family transposase